MPDKSIKLTIRDGIVNILELVQIRYIRKLIHDFSIRLPVKGHPLNKLFLKKDYWTNHREFPYAKKLLECIEPGDCVFDVGGFRGYYMALMSHAVGQNGMVVTFEPNHISHGTLKRTIHANSFLSNVKLVKAAVTDSEGSVQLLLKDDESVITTGKESAAMEEVEAVTMDAFTEKEKLKPSLIKIDVEGFEMKVLKGGKQTLSSCQFICCEIHPAKMQKETGNSESELLDFIRSLGFVSHFEFRQNEAASDSNSNYNVIFKKEV